MLNEIPLTTDQVAVQATFEKIIAAFNSSNVDALMALHTDDFVLMDPGMPTLHGKGMVREVFARLKREKVSFHLRYAVDELEVQDKIAFIRGELSSRMMKDEAPPVFDKGRFLCLFRKQSSGDWLRSHVMVNKVDAQPFV
jgi:ketosteroid isomerase-like protein